MSAPLIELRDVCKSYEGVDAVRDVSFAIEAGEVTCLLGDNGAGKSTLIKMMSGMVSPSSGELRVDGERVALGAPRQALNRGIATVHQYGGTVPLMSVARNFFLGAEPLRRFGPVRRLDMPKANAIALEQVRGLGITRVTDGSQLVGTLSGGERQALAIARAMYFGARVLILDEPTSALGVKEAAKVLRAVQHARSEGVGVVLVTHNAHHALTVGDRFVVLIHGAVAADFRRGERSKEELINLMAGGEELDALEHEMSAE